jgi:hypothetical protein
MTKIDMENKSIGVVVDSSKNEGLEAFIVLNSSEQC